MFSRSDSLLSHCTTRFHRRQSLHLHSLNFVPNISVWPLTLCHSLKVLQVWEMQIHISVSHPLHRAAIAVIKRPPQSPTFVAQGVTVLCATEHPHPGPSLCSDWGKGVKGSHLLPTSNTALSLLWLSVCLGDDWKCICTEGHSCFGKWPTVLSCLF